MNRTISVVIISLLATLLVGCSRSSYTSPIIIIDARGNAELVCKGTVEKKDLGSAFTLSGSTGYWDFLESDLLRPRPRDMFYPERTELHRTPGNAHGQLYIGRRDDTTGKDVEYSFVHSIDCSDPQSDTYANKLCYKNSKKITAEELCALPIE